MLQNLHHQFKSLRERLVAEYLKPTFDADEVAKINQQLEELLSQMNFLEQEVIEKLRQCFRAELGCREAARRTGVNRNTVVRYYHQFRLEDRTSKLDLGEPPPERSALHNHKPWQPQYEEKFAITVKTGAKPKSKMNNGPMPTADQVGRAVVIAGKLMGANPMHVLVFRRDRNMTAHKFHALSRARTYVAMALREVFPNTARPALARICGFEGYSVNTYYSTLDNRIKNGELKWFDQTILDQVIAGIAQR